MKTYYKIIISMALTAILSAVEAQNPNEGLEQNVDTISFRGLKMTPEIEAELAAIPLLSISSASEATVLPNGVDNSKRDWFRGIFSQTDDCCGQAAGVGYVFTYEVNRMRLQTANVETRQYPTHFTYNFLNESDTTRGSWPHNGWDVIKQMGVPSVADYGGMCKNLLRPDRINVWETGYDHYYHALSNKVVLSYEKETVLNNTQIDRIKHWLNDHGNGDPYGGLAVFCANVFDYTSDSLPPESDSAGQWIVTGWGNSGLHAMTIVGYDDNIMYDFDGDGSFTNQGNISTWERGAFIVVNSWGTNSWLHGSQQLQHNQGYLYIPYRLAAVFNRREVYCLSVAKTYTPEIVLKARIKHPSRLHLEFYADYSSNAYLPGMTADSAYDGLNWLKDPSFNSLAMQGLQNNNDPIELGLDFGQFFKEQLDNKEVGKVFFVVKEVNDASGTYDGEITNFSLFDYRWNEIFELSYPIDTVSIENDSYTRIGINYDLLPFDGTVPTNWNSDKVARRTVNVGSNTQISDDVNLDLYGTDLYDCEIFIKSNTTLTIGDGVTFTAKRGTCRIVVNGNLVLGENVSFRTENGATLLLEFSNAQSVSGFVGTTFQNCSLNLPNKSLSFQECSFDETPLVMRNQSLVPSLIATVEGCSFNATANQFANAIKIENYDSYLIKDNSIDGNEIHYTNGIFVTNCGNASVIVVRRIVNNNILDCYDSGLVFYASSGEIYNNKITGNKVGVQLLNNSNVKDFSGTCYVTDIQNTQHIHDNDNIEVKITRNCVPLRMKYNAITASASHPYIKYEDETPTNTPLIINMAYNHWGNGLNPSIHFVSTNPNVWFTYLPLWNPGSCLGNEGGDVRDMVTLADSLSDIGRFGEAKLVYKQIVSLYPSTVEAQVALKTLFNLECVSGLDFDGLKSYYLNDTVIAGNHNLNKLASSLSNRCNEVMRRFDDAIMWYEDVLLDTLSSFNDSIFAAIDLGELYLRMEAMGEKGVAGKLTQYIPVSREAHDKRVLYALSLLRDPEQTTEDDYPTDYWIDVVTEQPEGYVMDEQGNVTISSAEGLAWFAAVVNGRNGQEVNDFEGKTVRLVSDIDMGLHLWEAIGNSYYDDSISYDYVQRYFKGSFVGSKHEISNLVYGERGYYRRPDQFSGYDKCQGLFGNLLDAEVKGLKLNNFICLNQDDIMMHFGSIASFSEQSVIDRCVSKGSIYEYYNGQYTNNSEIYAGGLVYNNLNSAISNCVFVADSCVSYEMGGIAHSNITTMENHRAEISNCYFYGEMYDDPLIFKNRTMHTSAGIVQYNSTDPDIEQGAIVRNCYYYPTEPRGDMVGYRAAVAWWHQGNSSIENCYYLAEHDVAFYTGVVSRQDEWATLNNTSAFYYANDGCVLENPVEIGGNMVSDLKEALNRWGVMQQNSSDYENWCDDVWMEQGGAPLLCAVYEATEEKIEKTSYVVPNPVENMLSIISDEVASVAIYDATGRLMVETTDKQLDMTMYKPGLYFVSVLFNDGRCHVQKIVKK